MFCTVRRPTACRRPLDIDRGASNCGRIKHEDQGQTGHGEGLNVIRKAKSLSLKGTDIWELQTTNSSN